jgi:3-oxoacyl-ACP reductase-like protein
MGWACSSDGEERGVYRVLVGKSERKKPLGRSRCRWEDNINMGLQEVGCGGMDWIGLVQDRDRWRALVNAVMNLLVP